MPGYQAKNESKRSSGVVGVNSNEKCTGMKNTVLKTPGKDQIMSQSDFHTVRGSKLQVRVLLFSVLNVSALIRGLTRAINLKKQCIHL